MCLAQHGPRSLSDHEGLCLPFLDPWRLSVGEKLHPANGEGDKAVEKRRDVLDVVTIGCLSPSEETPTLIDTGLPEREIRT